MNSKIIDAFMDEVGARNGHEPEFMQAVQEVAETVIPYIVTKDIYHGKNILMRMVEPERAITFRVAWVDDQGEICVNRGYRIQMNSAIGPYKGGLRFHPTVDMSILKFLAFEQVFKTQALSRCRSTSFVETCSNVLLKTRLTHIETIHRRQCSKHNRKQFR